MQGTSNLVMKKLAFFSSKYFPCLGGQLDGNEAHGNKSSPEPRSPRWLSNSGRSGSSVEAFQEAFSLGCCHLVFGVNLCPWQGFEKQNNDQLYSARHSRLLVAGKCMQGRPV